MTQFEHVLMIAYLRGHTQTDEPTQNAPAHEWVAYALGKFDGRRDKPILTLNALKKKVSEVCG